MLWKNGTMYGTVAAVVGIVLVLPSTASAQNLLVNPSFEETIDWGEGPKPAGWGVWGNTWSVDAGDANATLPPLDGDRMELAMGPWWCPWCNSGFVQDHPAAEGQLWGIKSSSYAPSAFSIAGTQNFMVMKIEFWDHFDPHPEWGETPLAQPEVIIADGNTVLDQWQDYHLYAAAPAGTVMARAAFVFLQPNWEIGAAMVDDASFGPAVDLDIKPGSCPNSFNRVSHGVLPVGLLAGAADFDVTMVDVASVRLSRADGVGGEVAPNEGPPGPHSVFADVGTPFSGVGCDCHELTGDGTMDLMMHFRTDDVVETLQLDDLPPAEAVELVVSGNLLDGTPFAASDCVTLVPAQTPPANVFVSSNVPGGWIDATPLDSLLDGGGFADFERSYLWGETVTLTAETASTRPFVGWEINGVLHRGDPTVQIYLDSPTALRAVYRYGGISVQPRPSPVPERPMKGADPVEPVEPR